MTVMSVITVMISDKAAYLSHFLAAMTVMTLMTVLYGLILE